MKCLFSAFALLLAIGSAASAESSMEHADHAAHLNAPIGIMGDHVHAKGDWMFSYRYQTMQMNQNMQGDSTIADADILRQFMVTPTEMDMQMHMFSAMYGLSDRLSLMAMTNYTRKEMAHRTRMGGTFTTEAEGFGDTQLGITYSLWQHGEMLPDCHLAMGYEQPALHRLFLNAGLSLPTGSIDERDDTPAMRGAVLSYPMQLGSGTLDPVLGLTYTGQKNAYSWGAQGKAILRLYHNSEDYHLGNDLRLNLWAAKQFADDLQMSFRLEGRSLGSIDGADARLNPRMIPTADANRSAARSVSAFAGLVYTPEVLENNRFALEVGRPVYQHLDGPQMAADWQIQLGWQWLF